MGRRARNLQVTSGYGAHQEREVFGADSGKLLLLLELVLLHVPHRRCPTYMTLNISLLSMLYTYM